MVCFCISSWVQCRNVLWLCDHTLMVQQAAGAAWFTNAALPHPHGRGYEPRPAAQSSLVCAEDPGKPATQVERDTYHASEQNSWRSLQRFGQYWGVNCGSQWRETTGWPHFPLKCVVFQNSFKMLPFLPSFSTSVKKKRPYTKKHILGDLYAM